MWRLWQDIEEEMDCRRPFNPMTVVEESGQAADLFNPVPMIQMPSNLPPQMAQQVLQQILNEICTVQIPPIEYSLTQAIVESSRRASVFRSKGRVFARRDWETKISLNNVVLSSTWEIVKTKPLQEELGAQLNE